MASTKASIVKLLTEKPNIKKKMNVPTMDTGIASTGINVALQLCRKKNTTKVTKSNASTKVWITEEMDAFTTETVS
ncbi:hypothetical protein D3C73_1278210 [compost metagenome]